MWSVGNDPPGDDGLVGVERMRPSEFENLLGLLVEASPRSVFLEVAFMESWVTLMRRRQMIVPWTMIERSLPFWEAEFRWRPRREVVPQTRPAWAHPLFTSIIVGMITLTVVTARYYS